MRNLRWASIVKGNANYRCQICGSIELVQAHDPTYKHLNPKDGIALCAEHHSQQHPDIPRNLFFNKRMQPYWDNISASSLAKRMNVHPRTIIRCAKKINIPTGTISQNDIERLTSIIKSRQSSVTGQKTPFTIRMPSQLWKRLNALATKHSLSTGSWIVRTLDRESKPRN